MKITKHPLMLRGPVPPGLPLDEAVVRKLEASFGLLALHSEEFTRGFYDRLFAEHPHLRGLFKTDPVIQRAKLFDSLRLVVHHLKQPELQVKELAALGARHMNYGAKPEHYPIVCKLMVESMAAACGSGWNADLSAEWMQALQLVSLAMLAGGHAPGARTMPSQAGQSQAPDRPGGAAPPQPG